LLVGGVLGQKVHARGFRLGINKPWLSNWYGKKDYAELLHEDLAIRKFLKKELYHAGIANVEIERAAKKAKINIFAARPGIIIGKKGLEVDKLKAELQNRMPGRQVVLNIKEVRKPETNAQLIAENISLQLLKRVAFRRVMKRAMQIAMNAGAKGIRVSCSGRLAGSEIARTEWYREGRVPLHTLRADIDVGFAEALTTYGLIGVKVLVCSGEILPEKNRVVKVAKVE
jgi:small subunit ribosomal protein S3